MAKIIKEIVIILLACLLSMITFAIILYKYIPNKKVIPELKTYEASEQIQDLLEDNIGSKAKETNVILTYEVTKGDLSDYQKTNDYVPGKSNPFSEASKSVSGGDKSGDGKNDNGDSDNKKGSDDNENSKVTPSNPSIYDEKGSK